MSSPREKEDLNEGSGGKRRKRNRLDEEVAVGN